MNKADSMKERILNVTEIKLRELIVSKLTKESQNGDRPYMVIARSEVEWLASNIIDVFEIESA